MRIIDIGVAAGYGILCISLISVMNPYPLAGGGATAQAAGRGATAIAGYVRSEGLPFFAAATLPSFCSSLVSFSNSTVVLGGSLDGESCRPPPSTTIGSSALNLTVSGNEVELEAWVEEAQ